MELVRDGRGKDGIEVEGEKGHASLFCMPVCQFTALALFFRG